MVQGKRLVWMAGGIVVLALVGTAGVRLAANGGRSRSQAFRYKVEITNVTRGQIFSPGVVVAHTRNLEPIFMLGAPASPELASVAEDAVTGPLIAALEDDPDVGNIAMVTGVAGPIMPGETASAVIETNPRATQFTVLGMLVTTNDAFYGLEDGQASVRGSRSFLLPAYDAGSEANNELCSHIPGPPCGNAGVRDTEGAEGYVHIHAGIHGVGDLDPAQFDWRNPVARVNITRLGPGDEE